MKRLLPWLMWAALLCVAQTTVAPSVAVYHVTPDFFLISVVLVGMRRGPGTAALWGAFVGLLQDTLSGGVIGLNFFSKPAVGFAVGLLRPKLDFENPNTQTLATMAASAAEGLVLALLLNGLQPAKPITWSLSRIVLPAAVYNSLLLPILPPVGRVAGLWLEALKRRPVNLVE